MKTTKALLFCFIIALSSCEKENLPIDNQAISQDTKTIEAKKWFEKSNPELSILKYTKQIDWDHAIVTDGTKGKVVEVPIILEDDLMLKINNDNGMMSYHRLLFQAKNEASFNVSDVMFFTRDKKFDNTNKEINFYSGDKKFDGSIIVLDSKNELTKPREYENGEEVKSIKNNLTSKVPFDTCVYLGWYIGGKGYENTVFKPIALIGCFGGSSDDETDYGGPHGGSQGGNGDSLANTVEKKIDNVKLAPCPKEVMEKLKNAKNCDISNLLEKLGSSSVYNVTIQTEETTNGDIGQTTRVSKNNYNIRITPNYTDGTKLFRATVLLHELTHAFFMSLKDDYSSSTPPNPSVYNEFPILFQAYVDKSYPGSIGNAHHDEMATTYVNAIGSALQEYNTGIAVPYGTIPNQVYTDLAWGGLQKAPIFDTKFPLGSAERERIINRFGAESTGRAVEQGTSKEQKPIGKPCI